MNPDLHQLHRDLGLNVAVRTQPATLSRNVVAAHPVNVPAPSGLSLSGVGGWLLVVAGSVLALWLLAGPICALIGFIISLVSFIFHAVCWIFFFSILAWIFGALIS